VDSAGRTARTLAVLPFPYPSFAPLDDPIQIADVTGDGEPDFLVLLQAGSMTPGVIVSDDGGSWRLVPGEGGDVFAARDPAFEDNRLTTVDNDCVPDCATGHQPRVAWTYDRDRRVFVREAG
jgi:hypothetical protein